MPRRVKELSAIEVKRLDYASLHKPGNKRVPVFQAVGGVPGLQLQLTSGGGKSWIYRYSVMLRGKQKRRSLGLGSYPMVGVGRARELASEAAQALRRGEDPIKKRQEAREALAREIAKPTFAEAIEGWERANPYRPANPGHRQRWLNSVRSLDTLADLPVDLITKELVWKSLQPWIEKGAKDTSERVLQRIGAVMDWAADEGHLEGSNPATEGWVKRKMSAVMAGVTKSNRPAVQVADIPRWYAELSSNREGTGSRALEFLTLTAVRSGEVRGATWDEIDFDNRVWRIPAARMKMKRDHIVPLSDRAIALLEAMSQRSDSAYIFANQKGGMISDATMSSNGTMGRMHNDDIAAGGSGYVDGETGLPAVPHGLRSTFRVWAGRRGFPREHAELALAHKFGDAVEQAYQRDVYTEQRRPMMDAWAAFLQGHEADANVVEIRRA